MYIFICIPVPPEEPRIFDAQGKEISQMAGPFREGYELFLCCQVRGGKYNGEEGCRRELGASWQLTHSACQPVSWLPYCGQPISTVVTHQGAFFTFTGRPPPKVTWWRDGNELIGTSHTSVEEGATVMVNQLLIGTTTRDYYGARIECRAQGTRLLEPVTKDVTVQVHCKWTLPLSLLLLTPCLTHYPLLFLFTVKPIRVKIITPNDLLTAGHPMAIRCESWGSYPAAKIAWLLDGEPIRNAEVTVHSDKEVSRVVESEWEWTRQWK